MRLDGVHHVTCITADAPRNVDFYTRVLGLRMVKRTVNQDDPTVYHLFYADEAGSPGSDITFFEYPGARRGRAGGGMVHTVRWRVGSEAALDFWQQRLTGEADGVARGDETLTFEDFEGLRHELAVVQTADEPLIAEHPDVPAALALQGFDGVRAFAADPNASRGLLEEALAFDPRGEDVWETRGPNRGGLYSYDEPPSERGVGGAGTVHHVAWASSMEDHEEWRARAQAGGASPTPVIDRFWFRSIYFREPSGVLFEIATVGPGFGVDEDMEHLGESLVLPPAFEHMRAEIEPVLDTATGSESNPVRVEGAERRSPEHSLRKSENGVTVRADAQTEAELLVILERFCSGFAARDADGIMQLFAPDADIVMVTSEEPLLRGPDAVRAFLQRYAQGAATYSWRWNRRDVSAAGAVGWLLAEGTETAVEDIEERHAYRMSMVCEKRDDRWLLLQVHSSSPHHG